MSAPASEEQGIDWGSDDLVLPFRTVKSKVMGRLVRLGPVIDTIISRHAYPESVSALLGEAAALTAMLGAALKGEGRLVVQTKSDGPVGFLVVGYEAPGRLRAYASHDAARLATLSKGNPDQAALMGKGHLAMTIEPGGDARSYQGIVALGEGTITDAAHAYFRQSEQIPTFVRLVVARSFLPPSNGGAGRWAWRAGGLMIQHLVAERRPEAALEAEGDDDRLLGDDDEDWRRARLLAETVEDHELIDPTLRPERLLYRLFHEEGVRAGPGLPLEVFCRCARDRLQTLLKRFGRDELADMAEADGAIVAKCEFCTKEYRFQPDELG